MSADRHAAIHEAGHAVVARILGVPFTAVIVDHSRPGWVGRVEMDRQRPQPSLYLAMASLAGLYATHKAFPGDWRNDSTAGALPDGRTLAGSDVADVERIIRGDGQLLAEANRCTWAILNHDDGWRMVCDVADALEQRGRLSAAEVLALTS